MTSNADIAQKGHLWMGTNWYRLSFDAPCPVSESTYTRRFFSAIKGLPCQKRIVNPKK